MKRLAHRCMWVTAGNLRLEYGFLTKPEAITDTPSNGSG